MHALPHVWSHFSSRLLSYGSRRLNRSSGPVPLPAEPSPQLLVLFLRQSLAVEPRLFLNLLSSFCVCLFSAEIICATTPGDQKDKLLREKDGAISQLVEYLPKYTKP